MAFLTNEKLTIVGAAGMIGSNMAQSALMGICTGEDECRQMFASHHLPKVF